MRKVNTTFHVQQGSSGTLRVSDEGAWYFVGETWEGAKLLNTWVESRHVTKDEALAAWTMTLAEASTVFEIPYQTLATACQEGRLSARKSAGTWLVTARAIKDFKGDPDVRPLTMEEIESFPGDGSVNVAIRSTDGIEYYGDDDGFRAMFVAGEDGNYIPVGNLSG